MIRQDHIMSNFEQVSQTKSFSEMDRMLLLEVMQEACKLANKVRSK